MNPIKTLLIATALVASAAAPAAFAQPHRGGGPGLFGGHQLMEMLDDVGATDAQRQQIEAIFKAAREDLKAQMKDGRGTQQQMMKLWTAPNIDAAAMEALRKQQAQRHDKTSARMQQALVEAGRVLTPEQRAKIGERMTKRMARMHQRMQEHRGGV